MTKDKLLKLDLLKAAIQIEGKSYNVEQVIKDVNKMYQEVILHQVECNSKVIMKFPEAYWDSVNHGEEE